MNRAHVRRAGLGLVILLAQACQDSTGTPKATTVVLDPSATATLKALGETVQYSARLLDQKGREIPDVAFIWSISDDRVASVSANGLVTALKEGAVSVRASSEGITGSATLYVDPAPDQVTKVAGDLQFGTMRQVLPGLPTVEVLDANQNPIPGKFVSFAVTVGGGTVSPHQVQTDLNGRASTVWQLGCSNDNPQQVEASIGGISVSFTATVDLEALAICQDEVPDGRATQAYSTLLVAAGGDQSSLDWSVVDGALPPGLTLRSDGELNGVPTLEGLFQFRARVQDGQGEFASSLFDLRVCDAPVQLAPGERISLSLPGADDCGFFLPAGNGDRYRFGVVYARPDTISTDVPTVTVQMEREVGGAPASGSLTTALTSSPSSGAQDQGLLSPARLEAMEMERATEAAHNRMRMAERELLTNLGPHARPLPDLRGARRVSGPVQASPEKMTFRNPTTYSSCDEYDTARGIKILENDLMVIYQDSTQWAGNPLTEALAQRMLNFYRDNGKTVIDEYFGGTTDINGDGKIVVFVSPEVEDLGDGTIAFVWNGDFFPRTPQGLWAGCPASNQMEMMRFDLDIIQAMNSEVYAAVGTVVHEVKHISSLYKSLIRGQSQPLWVEEGTAEIAKEAASRHAWAQVGGPEIGALASASDVSAFTEENYGVILPVAGAIRYLSSQPNGVVATPTGAASGHSIYGSGWHFHSWLGDAYGNAAQPGQEAQLFRTLNDSLTSASVAGILEVTGASSWTALMEEYLGAILLNGTGAPQGSRALTTYDFPSITGVFAVPDPDGDYPWPVNLSGEATTASFVSDSDTGPIGPSGVRIFDVTSDGTGLGLNVTVSALGGSSPFRIVVVRIE